MSSSLLALVVCCMATFCPHLEAEDIHQAIEEVLAEPSADYPERLGELLENANHSSTLVGQRFAEVILRQEANDSTKALSSLKRLVTKANGQQEDVCIAMFDHAIELIRKSGDDPTAIMIERREFANLIESKIVEKNMRFDRALADDLAYNKGKIEAALKIYRQIHRYPLTRIHDMELFKMIARHRSQAQLAIIYHLRGDLSALQAFKESLSPIYTPTQVYKAVDAAIHSPDKEVELLLRQMANDGQ